MLAHNYPIPVVNEPQVLNMGESSSFHPLSQHQVLLGHAEDWRPAL